MGAVAEDVRVVGTLAAANDTVRVSQPGTAVVTAQLTGTFVGTVVFEVDNDEGASPTWVAVNAQNVNTAAAVASATAPGIFKIDAAGLRQVRVRCSAYTSGSIAVTLNASVAAAAPGLTSGGSAVSIADGSDTALGTTTDAKTLGDTNGTAISKLRGLSTILNDAWDSVNHWLQVKLMAALPAGNNIIGEVGGITTDALTAAPTITASTYTSGFSLGGKLTLTSAVRVAAGSGVIQEITVTDKAKANNAIDFFFFIAGDPTSTTFTDHAALTINAADLVNAKMVSFSASQYSTLATSSVGTLSNIGLPFKLTTGTTLYAAAVIRGTTTYASTSDLQFRFGVLLD